MRRNQAICLALLAFLPFQAAADSPYFRFRAGENGSMGGGDSVSGPSGIYSGRVGFDPGLPRPMASFPDAAWTLQGSLPEGMAFDPATGALSGRPSVVGDWSLVLRGEAGGRSVSTPTFRVVALGAPGVAYGPLRVPAAAAMRLDPERRNLGPGATYEIVQGAIPAGMSLDRNSGLIQGQAPSTGSIGPLRVTVVDGDGARATSDPFSIEVVAPGASVAVSSGSPRLNVPYAQHFSAQGLLAPVAYRVAPGAAPLPPGIEVDGAGQGLTGVPTKVGSYTSAIEAKGADGTTVLSQPFGLIVYAPEVTVTTQEARVGQLYAGRVAAHGMEPGVSFAKGAGTWPDGIDVAADGAVGGRPGAGGRFGGLTVVATDGLGSAESAPFAIDVKVGGLAVSAPASAFTSHTGYPLAARLTVGPSAGAVSWKVVEGSLPDNVGLSASEGLIGGTPTLSAKAAGIVVQARDGAGQTGVSEPLTFDVLPPPAPVAQSLYVAPAGQPFQARITARNLIGQPTYSVDPATLPAGLTMGGDGLIKGTPLRAGNNDGIVVQVTDGSDGASGSGEPFSIQVTQATNDLAIAGLSEGYRARSGRAVPMQAPAAVNARGPPRWSIDTASTALPAGLAIDPATGTIAGTTAFVGEVTNLRLRLTDDAKSIVSQAFSLRVAPPLALSGIAQAYRPKRGAEFAAVPAAQGLLGAPRWELSGDLPEGLALSPSNGAIGGYAMGQTPGGGSSHTLRLTDGYDGSVATAPFVIDLQPGVVVDGPTLLMARTGKAFTSQGLFRAVDPVGAVTWEIAGPQALPDGLSFDRATGTISGVPTREQSPAGFVLRARQADGATGESRAFAFNVLGTLRIEGGLVQSFKRNRPGSVRFGTVGAEGAVSWSLAGGGLPAGLSLDVSDGRIYGNPPTVGDYGGIVLRATDSSGATALSDRITLRVLDGLRYTSPYVIKRGRRDEPMVSTPGGIENAVGKVRYAFADGNPFGWTIDPDTGALSGKLPNNVFGYLGEGFVIATDETGDRALSRTAWFEGVDYPWYADCNFYGPCYRDWFVGTPVTWTSGDWGNVLGTPSFDWAPGTPVPPWLTLDPRNGTIYGTAPASPLGSHPARIRVTDSYDGASRIADSPRYIWIRVDDRPPTPPTDGVNFNGRCCTWYDTPRFLDATGLAGPIQWTVTRSPEAASRNLNVWENHDGNVGRLQFIYPYPGWYPGNKLEARGADGTTISRIVNVYMAPQLSVEYNADFMTGCRRIPQTFNVPGPRYTGVQGTPSFRIASDNVLRYDLPIPPGLTLDPATGAITGTVTGGHGQERVTLAVKDSWDGAEAYSRGFYFNVYDALEITGLQDQYAANQGQYVSIDPGIRGTDYLGHTMDITGELPPGMYREWDSLRGRPERAGDYSFTFKLTSKGCDGASVSRTVNLRVNPFFNIRMESAYGQIDKPFSASPIVTLAKDRTQWAINDGHLPSGLTFDPNSGTISGTPKATASERMRLRGWDQHDERLSNWFTVTILEGPAVSVGDLRTRVGRQTDLIPGAQAFYGPASWSATGTLPPGLGVNPSTGVITGVPYAAGTYPGIRLSAVSPGSAPVVSQPFSIVVDPGLTVAAPPVTEGMVGQSLAVTPSVQGNLGAVGWTLTPVTDLQRGLSFASASGAVTGTPASEATRDFTLSATDSDGSVARAALRIKVGEGTPASVPQTWTIADTCPTVCSLRPEPGTANTCVPRRIHACTGPGCTAARRSCNSRPATLGQPSGSYAVGTVVTEPCEYEVVSDDPAVLCPRGGGIWLPTWGQVLGWNGGFPSPVVQRYGCRGGVCLDGQPGEATACDIPSTLSQAPAGYVAKQACRCDFPDCSKPYREQSPYESVAKP